MLGVACAAALHTCKHTHAHTHFPPSKASWDVGECLSALPSAALSLPLLAVFCWVGACRPDYWITREKYEELGAKALAARP